MKQVKGLILLVLIIISYSSKADSDIDSKLNCAADAIVFNLMFADKDNPNISSQKERIAVWNDAITRKLVESGKDLTEAEYLIREAVKKSRKSLASIFKDKYKTKSDKQNEFDNWWIQTTRCMKKYSNIQ